MVTKECLLAGIDERKVGQGAEAVGGQRQLIKGGEVALAALEMADLWRQL